MEIFLSVLTLLGGLAMFLYGMRLMGDNLKEGSSGALKVVMEKVTNNPFKAFLLGLIVTGIIQSSTACIVITSGLVAAGIIKPDQSFGIIIGANVGTTVTGQIIRLLDINDSSGNILQLFKPSTLAPLALIIGIVMIMGLKFKNSNTIGNIVIGFGVLFSGLLTMTDAVTAFGDSLGSLFTSLGNNHLLGYLSGAGVAFVLQSSSATIGILQAFSTASAINFNTVYMIIVGIYLGDCVTTGIVCSIGAVEDARRVGVVNIIYNLAKTLLIIIAVTLAHQFGLLDNIWNMNMSSGNIADANTIFNLGAAVLLLPFTQLFGKLSRIIVKDKETETFDTSNNEYSSYVVGLNPTFYSTPAIAFKSCYDVLRNMYNIADQNIYKAIPLLTKYDEKTASEIEKDEKLLDYMADQLSNYLVKLSQHVSGGYHSRILDQYYKLVTEFERLGDYACNILNSASEMHKEGVYFSQTAKDELEVVTELLKQIMDYARISFEKRDLEAARHVEPLEEVMDDLINALHDNHIARLCSNNCTIIAGTNFLNVLSNIERISDTCSDIGVATLARVNPDVAKQAHMYISSLHQGKDTNYNQEYHELHDVYFDRLQINTAGVGENE